MITEVVDAHHHFWNPAALDVPWLNGTKASFGDPSQLRSLYTGREYRADAAPLKIKASVHVEPAGRPENSLLETFWLTGLGDGSGLPDGIVAYCDIEDPNLERVLDEQQRSPRLRGVRQRLNFDAATGRHIARSSNVMTSEAFRDGLRRVGRRNLVFNLSIFAPQLPTAAELARAVPECTIVLEHLGWPIATDPQSFDAWRDGMMQFAAAPNTAVKISGLWSIDRDWNQAVVDPWIRATVDIFGEDRCMFGSNLPIEKLMCPLPRQVSVIQSALADLGAAALEKIFVANTLRLYAIPAAG
jgi:predicted TIM-barrel fold metal-dependent hydrolase